MYLKRLEISGFKSFADNIKLDFEPGLTAVVGPNGCGKSNIVDAIRWCLGEMSAKSLRSNMMLDVLFNGSGSRPPTNMAQVTLTFDNTDKQLPIDYSEVSVSRRLFRSGESEYFINKTQCRLRDIKELFLDTGMGEDGYSSMEQGRVEWILQAKPEERRELFEEAAGVSKYRARREEALRKLDRLEIDLSRLSDIVNVTQEQIRKLENAVNKAKNYQRLREELKSAEIRDWLAQIEHSGQELADIGHRRVEAQNKTEELSTRIHQQEAALAEQRLALTQLEEELMQANGLLAGIDADIKIGEERLVNYERREQELDRQIQNIKSNTEREKQRIEELLKQETEQLAALNKIKSDDGFIENEFQEAKSAHEEMTAQLEEKREDVKRLRDHILDQAQERSRVHQQMNQWASNLSRLESEIGNREKELGKTEEQARELGNAFDGARSSQTDLEAQLKTKSESLADVLRTIDGLNEQAEAQRVESLKISEEIARLRGQIQSIRDQQTLDPYMAGAHAILSAGFPGVQGPLGKLFQTSTADRDLVSSTLGEHLGDLVANSIEDAQKAIDFLAAEGKGRARVWILDRLPQAPVLSGFLGMFSAGDRLQDRIQCADSIKPLLRLLCSGLLVKGSHVYGNGMVNGGTDPAQWQSHIPHRLPELEKQLESAEEEKQSLESAADVSRRKIEESVHARDNALKELEEVRVRLEIAVEEIARLEKKKEILAEEKRLILAETEQLRTETEKAIVSHRSGQEMIDLLNRQETENHGNLDIRQQELTEVQTAHANATAELASKQEKMNSFQERVQWQASILEHTRKDLAVIRQSFSHHETSLKQMDLETASVKTSQAEAQERITEALTRRQSAAAGCASLQTKRATLTETINASQSTLETVRTELSTQQERVQQELLAETTLKTRVESLVQKLQDQYELSVETAKTQFSPLPADPELLERLKKRVNNIGPVNLAAPQEHAELVERNAFLTKQQEDLLKAKDDLRQVIAKINATTREHFRETFHKVRENFRMLYAKLFQGGEADLHFTNEADILATGIDIFCQPPGKKLLHISLLSGGEKALTAIALLFAFFQVRPSPLALLDEVDAPLDEANAVRYIDMVKEFTVKSQFVLITHNKRTMEAANTLYGVTMEELGVSKILSARLYKEKETSVVPEPVAAS